MDYLDYYLSGDINGCPLNNTIAVRKTASEIMPDAEIKNIWLVGFLFEEIFLTEWNILLNKEDQDMILRIPAYVPENEEEAKILLEKHNKACHLPEQERGAYVYSEDDFIFMGDTPCLVTADEEQNLYIKRIALWGFQSLIENFTSMMYSTDNVSAKMVIIKYDTIHEKGIKDIGWLISINGELSILSIDNILGKIPWVRITKAEEISKGYSFTLNGIDYIVDFDSECGVFFMPNNN